MFGSKVLHIWLTRYLGTLKTTATWIREYIRSHPEYKFDSVVSPRVNYDLIKHLDRVERGQVEAPDLLPPYYAQRQRDLEKAA